MTFLISRSLRFTNGRQRLPMLIGAFGVIVLGIAVGMPFLDTLETQRTHIRRASHVLKQVRILKKQYEDQRLSLTEATRHLTFRTESGFQAELETIVEAEHLRDRMRGLRAAGSVPGLYRELIFEASFAGLSFSQGHRLLLEIEQLPPPIQIKSVQWKPSTQDQTGLDLTLVVSTYEALAQDVNDDPSRSSH